MIINVKLTWKAYANVEIRQIQHVFSLNTEICSQGLYSLGINSLQVSLR